MAKPQDPRNPQDPNKKAREAAEAERRSEESGAHQAERPPDRDDEHLIERDDHSMESLRRDDRARPADPRPGKRPD